MDVLETEEIWKALLRQGWSGSAVPFGAEEQSRGRVETAAARGSSGGEWCPPVQLRSLPWPSLGTYHICVLPGHPRHTVK